MPDKIKSNASLPQLSSTHDNFEDKHYNDREVDQHVMLAPSTDIYERNVETKRAIYLSSVALDTTLICFRSLPTDANSARLVRACNTQRRDSCTSYDSFSTDALDLLARFGNGGGTG